MQRVPGRPSVGSIYRCALRVRRADRSIAIVRGLSRRDYLRSFLITRVLGWWLIRRAHSLLLKAESTLDQPAWQEMTGCAEAHDGVREKRRILEGLMPRSGDKRRHRISLPRLASVARIGRALPEPTF